MKQFDYTVETVKTFEDAVQAVEKKAAEKGFRVLATHNVAATLAEKGFAREPLKIVEVCNARYASEVLKRDVKVSLMLPCPISVYVEQGKTWISTLRPRAIVEFFPEAGLEPIAREVEKVVLEIVNDASVSLRRKKQ
jgi:uncharacterized protein (DUF302 family)